MTHYKVAIVGASGLVGRTVLRVLEEKNLPHLSYTLFSSAKSAGSKIKFLNQDYILCELKEDSFHTHFDYAIFCAGGSVSEKYAPIAVSNGCTVIDNSSVFRMHPDVPLVVPEVNPEDIFSHKGIIANPNCSTIQAMLPLKALDLKYQIKRIVYSTYQAVSGAGRLGIEDLENRFEGEHLKKFPCSIYNNCIPHIDVFMEQGYTKEEYKMMEETKKILHQPNLAITATCVRVPVVNCHGESINVELDKDFDLYDIRLLLENLPNVVVVDNPEKNYYPLASKANGNDEVFVGRIRRDFSVKNGLNLWVVADNLRKGAGTNAIQILEKLIKANHTLNNS
ncbi:MAG: aspartate-semialdehyde dehydrogenase [Clostridia bacterium]|nr:aspartate-semialdehyde dehydrogenase [Clostridia bacterium]